MNVRDLQTGDIWSGEVKNLDLVIDAASKYQSDDGFTVRILCNDPALGDAALLDSIQLKRSAKNGRYLAKRDDQKSFRWFKFVLWLIRAKRAILNADCDITVQIGRLTLDFTETEISLILKRKGPFINQKQINL